MLNVLNAIVSALSVVSEIDVDDFILNNSIEIYTENRISYNEVLEILENIGAVEDEEETDNLNYMIAPDEDIYYTVFMLNGLKITVQLNMM